ncbi:MAG: flavodoxin family protein [Lachnospiraceae bacterium]|nr:flavodoxin family protein [Lachnospiraceae bacterium]
MKVLLINGSPHEKGCTYRALEEVAKVLNENQIEAEIFWIGTKPLAGCLSCMGCRSKGSCVLEDKVNEAAAKMEESDGIIVGSPVHYAAASGQVTSFLDRLFYSSGKKLAYKPGAAVVSCRRGGASAAFDQLNKYFTINNMPIVSSQYWNQVHGNTPDEVSKDEEGLQTMRTLGRNMAWLLRSLEAGRKAGVSVPEAEQKISTNFIR